MANKNCLSIVKTETFYGNEIVSIKSKITGKLEVKLAYQIMDSEDKKFYYATICPYFDFIEDKFKEVIDLLVGVRKNPFSKNIRSKLANDTFLNNPPFKKTLLLHFKEVDHINKIIWFCQQDEIEPDSKAKVVAVRADLEDGSWGIV